MTDDWDFYFIQVDEKPASMFVDLGIHGTAPVRQLGHMAYVRLFMNHPREDGLSSQEEFKALNAIEDALSAELSVTGTGYVGRCTTAGCRDFFFYIAQPADWDLRVAACLRRFPDYRYTTGTRDEPEWRTYFSYLYPSAASRQSMSNHRVCQALEDRGDRMELAREIDHWIYFDEPKALNAFIAEVRAQGFEIRNIVEPGGDEDRYSVQIWRIDVPAFNAIDSLTLPLFHLAAKHGGAYDGWETVVITDR